MNATTPGYIKTELVDEEEYHESKPLVWLWRGFDATPLADHVALALRFRSMLAKHLFEECGENC